MKDIKVAQDLAGDEHWPTIPMAVIAGDESARAIPEGATQPEGEETVQTWQRVAILEVVPKAKVYWGFMVGTHAQFMNVPVELDDGKFGVRVGDGEVSFFIIPEDLTSRLELKLVGITLTTDPAYRDLPLY